jgi:mono/diheme cytochrome c family protein
MNIALTFKPLFLLGLRTAGALLLVISSSQVMAKTPQAIYASECSACHIAYPAGLLQAPAWERIMGGLKSHFGADASLDNASKAAISSFLMAHAGTDARITEPTQHDRITETRWFKGRHGEVSRAVWKRASVGNASNCGACHSGASQGDFDEDNVRIPG